MEEGSRSRSSAAGMKKKRMKKKTNFRKKRPPLSLEFDYKDLAKLAPFLTEEGKIVGARISGLRAFQQRQLTLSVKRARQVAFLSPTTKEFLH